MKLTKSSACLLAACSFFSVAVSSCSEDPNPVDSIFDQTENINAAYVSLDLSVAATRADDPNSTPAENEITSVDVYIFNAENTLETIHKSLTVTANKIEKLETTPGVKTIYAVIANAGVNVGSEANGNANVSGFTDVNVGLTMEDFEKIKLNSTVAAMTKTGDTGCFAMVGKSAQKNVVRSSSAEGMPVGNTFSISLTRLAAKAQVIIGNQFMASAASKGFEVQNAQFAILQTPNTMQLVPNTSDLINFSTAESEYGIYNGYTRNPLKVSNSQKYNNCDASFSASNCQYMPENIVKTPVSGNVTFASVKVQMTPKKLYSYDNGSKSLSVSSSSISADGTFYAVAVHNAENATIDYVLDNDNNVICLSNYNEASEFYQAMNDGGVDFSMKSASDVAAGKSAASSRAGTRSLKYELSTFTNGYAYYRVNIAKKAGDNVLCRVDRNTFYKITLNSLNSLGSCQESFLVPSDPTTPLIVSNTAWIDASISVVDWTTQDQSADL